jgi:hypothetical protein
MFGFAPFASETFASYNPVAIVYGNIENITLTLAIQQKQDVQLQLEYDIINIPLAINTQEPIQLSI